MLFSVIVPVYNAAEYLKICIDSILEQTFSDFELILVNDGSTDQSGSICDAYASGDGKVKVIHQDNGGQTLARTAGLRKALGNYVIYVDADDWIEKNMLESAARIINEYHAEVITYAHRFEYADGRSKTVTEPVTEGFYNKEALRRQVYPSVLMDNSLHNMSYTIGKVVEKKILVKCHEKVKGNLRQGEDAAVSVHAYAEAGRVYFSVEEMYHYRILERSASNGFRPELYEQIKPTIQYFETLHFPEIPDFQEQVHRYAEMVLFSIMVMAVEKGEWRRLKTIKEFMNDSCFRNHLLSAKFTKVTPKTRITFWLFGKNRIAAAYWFLTICRMLKKRSG